jgi:outer membrane autotransporter protein
LLIGVLTLPVAITPLQAQTFNVLNGESFSAVGIPAYPTLLQGGSIINLQGNAAGDVSIGLPGAGAITVNGAVGSIIAIDSNPSGTNLSPLFRNTTSNPVVLNLSGGPIVITGGSSTVNGSVLYSEGNATINMERSVIMTVNTSGSVGGAVFSNGILTMDGGDIAMITNTAPNSGGAIFGSNGVHLALTAGDLTLIGNEAALGGAIGTLEAVRMGHIAGMITLEDNVASSFGGAVYAGNTSQATTAIQVYGALTARNNIAGTQPDSGSGGVFYAQSGDIRMDGGDIVLGGPDVSDGNQAMYTGGAIYTGDGDIRLATSSGDVTIENNRAYFGGALYSTGTTTIGNQNSITALNNNHAGGSGGAVFAINPSGDTDAITITGTLTAKGNTAGQGQGGVLLADRGNIVVDGGDITIGGPGAGEGNHASFGGGAIASYEGDIHLAMTSGNVTLEYNDGGDGDGGALLANGLLFDSLVGKAFIGHTGSTTTIVGNKVHNSGLGGAIYATNGIFITGNLIADRNTAGTAGAFFTLRKVSQDLGNVSMDGNEAAGLGGAIAVVGDVSLAATSGDVSLTNNSAVDDEALFLLGGGGGAIYALNGEIYCQRFSGQSCEELGIPELAGTGNVALGNSNGRLVINGNTAHGSGGAIWANNVTLRGVTGIRNNHSTEGDGGAILTQGNLILSPTASTVIAGNSAGLLGGAFRVGGNLTLNATSGDITFAGNTQNTSGNAPEGTATANAIRLDNTGGGTTTTLNAELGYRITFYDPMVSNVENGPVTVNARGGGEVIFDGADFGPLDDPADRWSKVYGITTVKAGTTFLVRNNAVYGARRDDSSPLFPPLGSPPSSFTVENGAMLGGGILGEVRAEHFTLNGVLNISGSTPTVGQSFSTFTVTSQTVALGDRSWVEFATYLGDDGSPTDKLVINGGEVTGHALVSVINVGGPGARTDEGIRLVEVINGGSTPEDAFTLEHRVTAGSYEYLLYRGGAGGENPDDWYLRSFLNDTPIYRSEVAVYGVMPALARSMAQAVLGTLHQRVGEQENLRRRALSGDRRFNGVWGRVIGEHQTFGFDGATAPIVTGNLLGFQAGVDLFRRTTPEGSRDHLGLYFGWDRFNSGSLRGDILGRTDAFAGEVTLSGSSTGAYWTHYTRSGAYLDAVVQGSWIRMKGSSVQDSRVETDSKGITVSLETGMPHPMGERGRWLLEPQAQLIYQTLSVDDASDDESDIVWSPAAAWTGRLGLRLQHMSRDDEGGLWQPYGRINLWQSFSGNDELSFDGMPPNRTRSGGTSPEIGAGMTTRFNRTTSMYGEMDYLHSMGGRGERSGVSGSLGVRINW